MGSGNAAEERGFSRAIRPNQTHNFAAPHGETDIIDRDKAAIGLGEMSRLPMYERGSRSAAAQSAAYLPAFGFDANAREEMNRPRESREDHFVPV